MNCEEEKNESFITLGTSKIYYLKLDFINELTKLFYFILYVCIFKY